MAGLISLTICSVMIAGIMIWKMQILKKDIYDFANQLDRNLDAILDGKEAEGIGETQDILIGRVSEKLQRVDHIWKQQEKKSLNEKQMMKELISDISHQTKIPIANQKLYLEILSQESLSKEGQGFLRDLESQIDKIDFLLQSMVKMSRLEIGIIQIKKQKTDFIQTLSRAVASIVPIASKKQIEIFVECEERVVLSHDKKWTEEAIFNLLDNAVKYTDQGGKIQIALCRQEFFTRLSIKDTGKGIPLERQAQIFTRFYREPEVHEQEGVGIGLYLVRKIMELQNGYVEVRSEMGKGADFQLYFPKS